MCVNHELFPWNGWLVQLLTEEVGGDELPYVDHIPLEQQAVVKNKLCECTKLSCGYEAGLSLHPTVSDWLSLCTEHKSYILYQVGNGL